MTTLTSNKRYLIYVFQGNTTLGSIRYPLANNGIPHKISVDWLIEQIDADFGKDNWSSFEYYKEPEEA